MSDYITKSTLKKDYSLTDSLIKKLGEPDKIAPNPHYRSAAPMKLYLRERVEKWVEENAERVEKVIDRRKAREKSNPKPPEKIKPPPPRIALEYRRNVRQVGDEWSWSVYQTSTKALKVGWAESKTEAEAACDDIVREAQKQKYSKYFDYDDSY